MRYFRWVSTNPGTTRAELFAAYESTLVQAFQPGGTWVDPRSACFERGHGGYVMTAWNPGFDRPTATENAAANLRMHTELEIAGYEVWPCDGASPDGTFAEPGFLVWGMPRAEALEVARRYRQFAIYEYDEGGVRSVIPC